MGVDLKPKRVLNMLRKTLLIALLDRGPFLLERRVVRVLEQTLELVQVLQEVRLRDLQCLLDERAQLRVTLVEPAAGRDYEIKQ